MVEEEEIKLKRKEKPLLKQKFKKRHLVFHRRNSRINFVSKLKQTKKSSTMGKSPEKLKIIGSVIIIQFNIGHIKIGN